MTLNTSLAYPSLAYPYCKLLSTSIGLALLALSSTVTYAQAGLLVGGAPIAGEKYGVSVGINLMAVGSPYDLDGGTFSVLPSLLYDNDKVFARGSELGAYLIKNPQAEATVFFQPSGYAFDPDEAKGALQGLNEREWSGMAGASYMRLTPYGGFRGRLSTDIVGNSKGTVAQLSYLTRLRQGDWTLYPSVGVEWTDNTYNDYYYGVSADESAATGVAAYNPDSSISPYLSLNASYDINADWALFVGQSVGYLSSEQADSPMVDNRTTYRSSVGVLYEF